MLIDLAVAIIIQPVAGLLERAGGDIWDAGPSLDPAANPGARLANAGLRRVAFLTRLEQGDGLIDDAIAVIIQPVADLGGWRLTAINQRRGVVTVIGICDITGRRYHRIAGKFNLIGVAVSIAVGVAIIEASGVIDRHLTAVTQVAVAVSKIGQPVPAGVRARRLARRRHRQGVERSARLLPIGHRPGAHVKATRAMLFRVDRGTYLLGLVAQSIAIIIEFAAKRRERMLGVGRVKISVEVSIVAVVRGHPIRTIGA